MVLPGPARLSVRTLAWLLEAERIGEPHLVLAPTAVWHQPSDHDGSHTQEIVALGWYDRHARLEVEVAASLAVLCRAEIEFFGWINRGGSTIGVLAAATGGQAVLAVRDGDLVWVKPTGWPRLAETLAAQTADVPAGKGWPVTVARADMRGSVRGQRLTEAAVRITRASVAVQRVQRIIALPTTGSGELYAAVRDGVGRHLVSKPLCYAETRDGRYLNVAAGLDQVLVAPASRADLVARLTDLRRSLSR